MGHLINLLFSPPPMPEIDLPIAAHLVPGVKILIKQAFELAYYRGVYDGFVGGILVALLLVPSIKRRLIRGAGIVIDNI